MIIEYHRPESMEEALQLLSRGEPETVPMGGGTVLNRKHPAMMSGQVAVVDIQSLGLGGLRSLGKNLGIGASVTLQELMEAKTELDDQGYELPDGLLRALGLEGTYNLRHAATVAGVLVSAGGRSSFAVAMLALDAVMTVQPGDIQVRYGDLLPLRNDLLRGKLITSVVIPLNVRLAYHSVARTPADLPIVCVGAVQWPSGRTRVALGGWGEAPMLAFDGTEASGADTAARDAYSEATDEWATDYLFVETYK